MIKLGFGLCENDLVEVFKKLQGQGILEDQNLHHLPGVSFFYEGVLPSLPFHILRNWMDWFESDPLATQRRERPVSELGKDRTSWNTGGQRHHPRMSWSSLYTKDPTSCLFFSATQQFISKIEKALWVSETYQVS